MHKTQRKLPLFSISFLCLLLAGFLCCGLWMEQPAGYMDLAHASLPPCSGFPFGTDSMGRDLFSMIWYGGRLSLLIGLLSTLLSTALAVLVGAVCGLGPKWLDRLLMRFTELFLSIPSLLLLLLLQGILGRPSVLSLSLVIGFTGWGGLSKLVRSEVQQLRSQGYVLAARSMGASHPHIVLRHLLPNLFPSVFFQIIMNLRSAILTESTLSFLGLGLPLEVISWGSMLSLAEKAMLTDAWWVIVIPGLFLTLTLLSITDLGNALRQASARKQSYL